MPNAFDRFSTNRFLRAVPPAIAERLASAAEPVPMIRGIELVEAGAATENIYFPERGLISLVKPMMDGRTVEVGVVGVEGLSGVSALLGVPRSPFDAVVQVEGHAVRLRTTDLREEMERSPALARLVGRYMYFKMAQLAQTAACNRLHTLRQRCCRWLLVASDNARTGEFTLTHEFLAMMMGVNRPSLTMTLAGLQRRGLIRYRRASVDLLARPGIEEGACECYRALRQELDLVYSGLH